MHAEVPENVQRLIRDCWNQDPGLRPSIRQVRERLEAMLGESKEEESQAKAHQGSLNRIRRSNSHVLQANLLHQILPPKIASLLSRGLKVEAEEYDPVTIFFSDIVGFTDLSSSLPPQKVMDMLDRLYTSLDHLCGDAELFKVETIGDAYMCVGGLPEPQADHTRRVALFSLQAVRAANETLIDEDDPSLGYINIRVGFHSGPVVASVVGQLNPRYCLFGDTVNYASRMESNSLSNKINMSPQANTFLLEQVPDAITHTRGIMPVKGKGNIECFWLNQSDENCKKIQNMEIVLSINYSESVI